MTDLVRVGDVIAGKYRVEQVLGQGGMGWVVRATHLTLDEPVAIKLLLPEMAASASAVERFMREAKAAAKIKSEHVVRVLDVDKLDSGSPYIVMEHLDGGDLSALADAREGPFEAGEAVGYAIQACEALALAHGRGIVHRDIKPANLFIARLADGSSCLKVLDFGISKLAPASGVDASELTNSVAILGSPRYMSPEQFRAPHDVDARTDVWALGVVLYRLLTGKQPFEAGNAIDLCHAVMYDAPAPPRQHRPELPEALEKVLMTCLQKDREARYQTVAELAAALAPFAPAACATELGRIERIATGPASSTGSFNALSTSSPSLGASGEKSSPEASTRLSRPGARGAPPAKSDPATVHTWADTSPGSAGGAVRRRWIAVGFGGTLLVVGAIIAVVWQRSAASQATATSTATSSTATSSTSASPTATARPIATETATTTPTATETATTTNATTTNAIAPPRGRGHAANTKPTAAPSAAPAPAPPPAAAKRGLNLGY